MTAPRSGRCMCGAVRFSASALGGFGVCHCETCRRWAGSAMFAVTVPEEAMQVASGAAVATRRTSDWASRSWCRDCGSILWYRFDRGRDGAGNYEVAVGLLDEADDLTLAREIYADQAARCWTLAGDHPRLTRAETLAEVATEEGLP